jgi:hypothetical protein
MNRKTVKTLDLIYIILIHLMLMTKSLEGKHANLVFHRDYTITIKVNDMAKALTDSQYSRAYLQKMTMKGYHHILPVGHIMSYSIVYGKLIQPSLQYITQFDNTLKPFSKIEA